jgi:hypothetical protein
MTRYIQRSVGVFAVLFAAMCNESCEADLRADAMAAARLAVSFLTDNVSTEGGYLWRYSSDLALREGEGVVTSQTAWVQPPGTPSVGEAFVKLYDATGDKQFLAAARLAAEALRRGQMRSGGWQAMIEFEPDRRKKWAYRIEPPPDGRLARFYELNTNRPLYFTKSYELTYDDSDLPTHYSFKVPSRIVQLRRSLAILSKQSAGGLTMLADNKRADVSDTRIRDIVDSMEGRGAWLSNDGLRYHKRPGPVIDTRLVVTNLTQLALAQTRCPSLQPCRPRSGLQ